MVIISASVFAAISALRGEISTGYLKPLGCLKDLAHLYDLC